MCSGIPEGTYEIKIGESFTDSNNARPEFNTLRFDFKPASISSGSDAYIALSATENNVQVIVPGDNQKSTIFRGSKKPIKGDKECLLVFDSESKELRLEKITANIHVKKTRDVDLDERVEKQIEKLRREKMPPPPEFEVKREKERTFSSSSVSMEGEDNSDEEGEDDVSALEQLMAAQPKIASPPKTKQEPPPPQKKPSPRKEASPQKQHSVQKQPSPMKKPSKSILHEDLQLSESSSESEDMDE